MSDDRVYQATAFHPRIEGGRGSGTLTISHGTVRFQGSGQTISMPFAGLEVRRGGASQRLIFFEHPRHPEWSIYTTDSSILSDERLLADESVRRSIRRIRGEKRRGMAIGVIIVAAIIASIYGLVLLKDPLVRAVVRRVPPSVEAKLGDVALRQILLMSETVSEPKINEPLEGLLSRIATASGSAHTFRLHVIDDETVNAFALPGGHVLFNTGLLLKAESAEEIAGVMAHEIAHVTEQHSLQQIVSTIGVFALVQALFGDVSGLIAVAADGGARLLTMSFSRDGERDADSKGLEFLDRAQIDPGGMLSFFGKLHDEEKNAAPAGAAQALQLLSTHPATDERIARLSAGIERLRSEKKYAPLEFDLAGMQAAIREGR